MSPIEIARTEAYRTAEEFIVAQGLSEQQQRDIALYVLLVLLDDGTGGAHRYQVSPWQSMVASVYLLRVVHRDKGE